MRFTLSIDCDNAAFAPVHDDASEPERYEAAALEVWSILGQLSTRYSPAGASCTRGDGLYDTNGNRCGQWSLSDMDDAVEETPKVYVASVVDPKSGEAALYAFADADSCKALVARMERGGMNVNWAPVRLA